MFDIFDEVESDICRFRLGLKGSSPLVVFGVNPSSAGSQYTDKTISSVRHFQKFKNYGQKKFDGFLMLNLCAERTPKPALLEPVRLVFARIEGLRLRHREPKR